MTKKKDDEAPRCAHPPQDRRAVAGQPGYEWCEVCWEKVEK